LQDRHPPIPDIDEDKSLPRDPSGLTARVFPSSLPLPALGTSILTLVAADSDTLMAARSQPNDNWGSVGNGAKHGEKHVGGGSGM